MAAAKRHPTEQIVAKLREMEKLQAQGLSIPAACKRLGISDQTFYRWRLKAGQGNSILAVCTGIAMAGICPATNPVEA